MRVALAQINTTVGDIWGNVERMAGALERAVDSGADLVAYPELTIPGYPPEDLLVRPSFIEENELALREFAGQVPEDIVAAVGFVLTLLVRPLRHATRPAFEVSAVKADVRTAPQ